MKIILYFLAGDVEEKGNQDEENQKNNFQRNSRNYSTLQPSTKRSIATETDNSELDRHSDDEAGTGATVGWVRKEIKGVTFFRYHSVIWLCFS